MNELKKKIYEVCNQINQAWVTAMEKADESGEGISLTEVMSSYSEKLSQLSQHFLEFEQRIGKKKKGWM